ERRYIRDVGPKRHRQLGTSMSPDRSRSPTRPRPQGMTLTARGAERITAILAGKGTGGGVRIGVKKGGCAGMEYTMEWAGEPQPHDEVVEHKGARVLIDPKAVMYLLGAEMDYGVDRLGAQVVWRNPNQWS